MSILQNKAGIKGFVRIQVRGLDGEIKEDTGFMQNVITNAGLAVVADLVGGVASPAAFDYLAVGTSSTAEAATQTALVAEITTGGLARAQDASPTLSTTTVTDDTLELNYTWTASASHSVEEIGALNAASSGTMLGRKLTTTKSLVSGEQLIATYKFIFAGV